MKSTRAGLYCMSIGMLLVLASPDSPAGVMDAGKPVRVNVNKDSSAGTKKPTALPFGLKPVSSTVAFHIQQFQWEEFEGNGDRLLKEDGPLFGITLLAEQVAGRVEIRERLRLFGGTVDYEGATWDEVPLETEVGYVGGGLGLDGGFRFPLVNNLSAKLLAGLDSRIWQRDIKSQEEAQGYKEFWTVLQGRAGGALDARLPQGINLSAEVYAAIPLATFESVDLYGGVDLEPQQKATFGAELQATWKQLFASVFVESYEFDKSDSVEKQVADGGMIYTLELFQPKSEANIVGVQVGYRKVF